MDRVDEIMGEWMRERPDLDVTPQAIIGRLHRLAAHLTSELRAVYRQYALGEGEFDVLATLRRAGVPYERAPGELARHTMVTSGAMSKRIDKLERDGLVMRRTSADDGRVRIVALTGAGIRLIDEAFAVHMSNERRLLDDLDAADRTAIEAILTRWLAQFESSA